MNTPFDDDVSETGDPKYPNSNEDNSSEEPMCGPIPLATFCHLSLTLPRVLHEHPITPSVHLKFTVSLLGGDGMKRWSHFLKKICIDASASIFPVTSPNTRGQLLYQIQVDKISVVSLLDHRASHCFISKEWAHQNQMPLKPLPHPIQFSFFNGTHDTITHTAHACSVQIGHHSVYGLF